MVETLYLRFIMNVWIWDVVVWAIAAIVRNMNVMVSSQLSHIVHMIINTIIFRYIFSYYLNHLNKSKQLVFSLLLIKIFNMTKMSNGEFKIYNSILMLAWCTFYWVDLNILDLVFFMLIFPFWHQPTTWKKNQLELTYGDLCC